MALALSAMFVGALLVEAVSIADLLVNVIEASPEPALVTSEVTASLIWSLSTWVVANIFLEDRAYIGHGFNFIIDVFNRCCRTTRQTIKSRCIHT